MPYLKAYGGAFGIIVTCLYIGVIPGHDWPVAPLGVILKVIFRIEIVTYLYMGKGLGGRFDAILGSQARLQGCGPACTQCNQGVGSAGGNGRAPMSIGAYPTGGFKVPHSP